MAAAVLPIASPAPAQAQTAIWSATMTVGQIGPSIGFQEEGDAQVGSLDDTTFSYGGATHTIDIIMIVQGASNRTHLRFSLKDAGLGDISDLALHVGGKSFDFRDATYNTALGFDYDWVGHGLNWSTGDTVFLEIKKEPESSASHNQLHLTWSEPDSGTANSYAIQVLSMNRFGNQINSTEYETSTDRSYTDTQVRRSRWYRYLVTPVNNSGAGERTWSRRFQIPVHPQSLRRPANVRETSNVETQVTIRWNGVPGATGYEVTRVEKWGQSFQWDTTYHQVNNGRTFVDSNVKSGVAYLYWVRAKNAHGVGEMSVGVNTRARGPKVTGEAPPSQGFRVRVPSHRGDQVGYNNSLGAVTIYPPFVPRRPYLSSGLSYGSSYTEANLSWGSSDGSITGWNLYRQGPGLDGTLTTLLADTTDTSYTDTGLTRGDLYLYWVEAINAKGESEASRTVQIPPSWWYPKYGEPDHGIRDPTLDFSFGGGLPPPPEGLASVSTSEWVRLLWDDPGEDAITGYRILRQRPSLGESDDLVYVENTGSSAATYTDYDVVPGVEYVYRVRAITENGLSDASDSIAVTPPPPPPLPPSQQQQVSENSPATGAPVISGTAQVGETLTADTSGIADEDGLDNATFSYTLADADAGKAIKVRVSFSDDAGNDETLTSAATAAVAAEESQEPPPAPQNLTAVVNGDGTVSLSWQAPGEGEKTLLVYVADTGSTATSYTDTDVTAGTQHVYRVKAINDAGAGNQSNYVNVTPAQPEPEPAQNTPATGAPGITGTARVGETLTADTSSIADADGLDNATFSYQWLADGAVISGASGASYTLADADEGKAVRVRVRFSDDAGNGETLTSGATAAVEAAVAEEEPAEPPAAPRNLTAIVNTGGSVTLSWNAPDDDSITGYLILRRRPYEGEKTLLVYVGDTGSTATTWTDTNVTAGTQHVYRVKAINDAGAGNQSNYVNVNP